jgi:FKBP-type peptidyl-prolyl cis-trans isomerase FkpA
MKKNTVLFSAASALVLLFSSCSESSKFEGFSKADNGLYYKFFNHNEEGVKAQEGDVLSLRYQFMLEKNDSTFMDSKDNSRDGSGYSEIGIQSSSFIGSFEDGLMMMTKGDSAAFIAPADSFFLKTMRMNELPPFVKQGDYVKAIMKVREVRSRQEVEAEQKKQMAEQEVVMKELEGQEKPALDKYINDNKIKVQPTASGLYYIETKKGSGTSPKETDIVKVHYTGKLLDGTVFDSSVEKGQPIEFPLNGVIPGWIEGLQLMKKGGKCTLVIPSAIAYGPRGTGPIPPYSPLVFDIELIDIKAAPAQEQGHQPH